MNPAHGHQRQKALPGCSWGGMAAQDFSRSVVAARSATTVEPIQPVKISIAMIGLHFSPAVGHLFTSCGGVTCETSLVHSVSIYPQWLEMKWPAEASLEGVTISPLPTSTTSLS